MNHKNNSLIRIVFAGPPRSGKTTIIEALKTRLNQNTIDKWNIVFIEEAATAILQKTDLDPRKDPIGFQEAVSRYQIMEESCCISDTKNHNLSISDRGTADAFVYVENKKDAESILHQTLQEAVDRYNFVLFFSPFYGSQGVQDGNIYRYETENELIQLEQKTYDVWSKSKNLYIIPVFASVYQKVDYVVALLNKLLEKEVFI